MPNLATRSVHSDTECSNAQNMPYCQAVFGRTVNEKCLVRETVPF